VETRLSEADAVALARRGDASAFGVLVRAYQDVAFRTAYLILRDAPAAEDVTQDAFVRAHRYISRFREEEAFKPWLLRIVTNLALNEQRSRARKAGLLERAGRLLSREPAKGPEEILDASDEAAVVWRALNRLREDDRVILYLRYFLELDEKEMARVIGRQPGTVKSRLHRASRRLLRLIEAEYPELRVRND
jgi:RNA polymerase sigma-70 factor (ECF subfamily)